MHENVLHTLPGPSAGLSVPPENNQRLLHQFSISVLYEYFVILYMLTLYSVLFPGSIRR